MDADDDPSLHRLEASAPATGGLVVVKKKDTDSSFKVPKPSLLGLDRLAAQKRKEREDQKRLISFKDTEYDDDVTATPDHGAQKTPDHSSVHKLNRNYRESNNETPSHGGGVSEKARDRLAERSEKDKRGVYISSKDEKRNKNREDNRERTYDRRERDRHRDRGRDREHDRRREKDRDYERRRDRSERDSRHSSRSDRRRPTDSERSLHTPRFKDEPKTPYTAATASSSWDDDDEREYSSKRSSWDFPTPKDSDKRSEWSTRSNSSSIYRSKKLKPEDETPRPTPAHRFNAWANDRKRSGATPHTSNNN